MRAPGGRAAVDVGWYVEALIAKLGPGRMVEIRAALPFALGW